MGLNTCSVVITLAVQDWQDFGIIFGLLIINACLGLKEQLKARSELKKLTSSVVATISVSRDGVDKLLPITVLVPGT
jgi:magnesium-transporting ATPase (P-type)